MNRKGKSDISAKMRPEFIRYKTEDQEILQALFWFPMKGTKAAVIYVPSATGGFCGQHDLGPIASEITSRGFAFMATNVRTVGNPSGWTFARFEDCVQDVGAAVRYAKLRKFEDIVLVGHSLGGPRAMYYWVKTREPSLRALVFMGSITSSYEEAQLRWPRNKRDEFDAFLQKARDIVREGRGQEVLTHQDHFREPRATVPPSLTLSAYTFLNLFGTPDECDASTVKFGAQVTIPTLVVHSSQDEIALPKNAEEIYASLTSAPRRDLIWVEGNHMLADAEDARKYGEVIADWLCKVVPPIP
jgi:alpha-beta hydrolase superfamily lysophospholipase